MTTLGGRRDRRGVTVAALAVAVATAALLVAPASGPARADAQADEGEAARLLREARDALAVPHSGQVTVVSFTLGGPRVSRLEVEVGPTTVTLRSLERLLGGDPAVAVDVGDEDATAVAQRLPASPLGLDVGAILAGWDVTVGPTRVLDTGPAVPLHLVRATGMPVRETLFLDEDSSIPVRRETRGADGRVLRVVAYTDLAVEQPDPQDRDAPSGRVLAARTDMVDGLLEATAMGFEVQQSLDGGFELLTVDVVEGRHDVAVARYGDGLSIVSVYQLRGMLDAEALEGAEIRHVAGRDVWTWPGREPLALVWTGDGRTWTAVSDAPAEVIEGALRTLPGDFVGHDAGHRLRRGLDRVWRFVTAPLR